MTARKKAIELGKLIAKKRDGYICVKCGKTSGEVQVQGSHILPVSAGGFLAADPFNICALCSSCHMWANDSWHESPLDQQWFHDKFPGRFIALKAMQLEQKRLHPTIKKWEWELKLQELKDIYKSMK